MNLVNGGYSRLIMDFGFRTYNEKLPIYIAQQEEVIVGFACYDVVRGKKGLFGPMGIAKQNRVKGVGKNYCIIVYII